MQCDQGLDMPPAQIDQHRSIAINRHVLPVPLGRLNATPFDTQAQRVILHLLGQGKIALGLLPPVTGIPARLTGQNMPRLFPAMPLVSGIASLALMGRGCSSPQKTIRETENTLTTLQCHTVQLLAFERYSWCLYCTIEMTKDWLPQRRRTLMDLTMDTTSLCRMLIENYTRFSFQEYLSLVQTFSESEKH